MPYHKLGFVALAIAVMSAPSLAEAQGFTQRGTRTGAVAGAIIGGIVGDDNNEALAGAAIGGLVGGVTGRVVGRGLDNQYSNGYYNGSGFSTYRQPAQIGGYGNIYSPPRIVPVAPQVVPVPVYRRGHGGGGYYGRGGHYGRGGYGRPVRPGHGLYRGGFGTW